MWPPTCARATPANALRQSMWVRGVCCIPFLCPRAVRGSSGSRDRLMGLPLTATGFDLVQVHVDRHLSGKVHAVSVRSTDTAADRLIMDMALRSGDGIPDVLVVDHDPKITSMLFREFTRRIGSSLIVGSAYHKNTNAKTGRVKSVLGDTLRAFANGRKDESG